MRTARESCDLGGHSEEIPKKEQNTCAKQAHIFEIYHFLMHTCTKLAAINGYFQKLLFFV